MYSQQMFNEYNQDTSTRSAICRSWYVGVSYLPAAHAEQEAHYIALLLLLKLLEVLVGTHLWPLLAIVLVAMECLVDNVRVQCRVCVVVVVLSRGLSHSYRAAHRTDAP